MLRQVWRRLCAFCSRRTWREITTSTGKTRLRPRVVRNMIVEVRGCARLQTQLEFEFRRIEMPRNTRITRDFPDLRTSSIGVTTNLGALSRHCTHHNRACNRRTVDIKRNKRRRMKRVLPLHNRVREFRPRIVYDAIELQQIGHATLSRPTSGSRTALRSPA